MSKGAIFLAHLFLPPTRRISDPVSGFFMLNKRVVASAELKPRGYKILLEILVEGRFQRVVEVPFTFRTRSSGQSKLHIGQQIDYLIQIYGLMRRRGELTRLGKFCLVGASGVLVNEGLLWLLKQLAGLPLPLSSAISIESSILSNFVLNDYFTFSDRRSWGAKSFGARLAKFNLVSLGGLGLNMGILVLLSNVLGLHYLISNLFGIAVATIWNYLVNAWWTWGEIVRL